MQLSVKLKIKPQHILYSFTENTLGASYPPLSPKSLKRCGRVTTQQSSVSGGNNDLNATSQNDMTNSAHKNNFSRVKYKIEFFKLNLHV